MKITSLLIGSALLTCGLAAYAGDSSEKIPAPTLELRAAGTLPTPQKLVTSSPIPAPQVSVVPSANPNERRDARYDSYNVDAGASAQAGYSREATASPSVTVVR